ncbi:ABC transporter permease [Lacrimispora sp. 38-1]|uniref:ABC transporter permease n=1 Tax=Lacrimispora sp. 38-1 TaxID=3125778 RepID=UPI003CF3FAAF
MRTSFSLKMKQIWKKWEFILFLVIVLEIVIFATKNSKFLMPRVLFGSMNDIISICIISLFVTFVMITGGIDIQAGSIVGLSSIILGVAWQDGGVNIWAASFLAMAAAGVCGGISGFFIAYCQVQPMVVTLGGSFLYTGIGLLVSKLSATESYKGINGFPESFLKLSKFKLFGVIPSQVIIFLILAVLAYLLLHKTRYGRQVFLVGVNQNAAEYSGIHTKLIIMSTYVLSAVSASVAGIILTSYLGTAKSDIGATLTLPIITAVVLGGTLSTGGKGSVPGTALAAIAIGTLRFGLPLCFKVSQQYLDIPVGILLLVIIIGRAVFNRPQLKTYLMKMKWNGRGN